MCELYEIHTTYTEVKKKLTIFDGNLQDSYLSIPTLGEQLFKRVVR